jgi:hypothetical protein
MAEFNFPSDPVLDQVHTEGTVTYIWNGYGWLMQSQSPDERYVNITGDTMEGDLILVHHPVLPMEAATKQYVDDAVAGMAPITPWQVDTNGDAIVRFGTSIVIRVNSTGLIMTKDDVEVFSVSV